MLKNRIISLLPNRILEAMDNVVRRHKNSLRLKNAKSESNGLTIDHIDSYELLEIIKADLTNPVIYDIGAAHGTWAQLALSIFPDAKIECFEPLTQHLKTCSALFNNIPNVQIHPVALGAENYTTTLNVMSLSDASSVLSPSEECISRYHLSVADTATVDVRKLDDYISDNALPLPNLMKLDIQGFELEALKGATKTLAHTKYILAEVSFIELYKDQAYFSDIVCYLGKLGFELCAVSTTTPVGRLLEQTDVLFKLR